MSKEYKEPVVTITRLCRLCGDRFILKHPKDPWRLCEKCTEKLRAIVQEDEQ